MAPYGDISVKGETPDREMSRGQSEIYTTQLPSASHNLREPNSFTDNSGPHSYEEKTEDSVEKLSYRRNLVSDEPKWPKAANSLRSVDSEPNIPGSKPFGALGKPWNKGQKSNILPTQFLGSAQKAGQIEERRTSEHQKSSILGLAKPQQISPVRVFPETSVLRPTNKPSGEAKPNPPPKPSKPIQPVYPISVPQSNKKKLKDLHEFPWFHGSIDRETATERLKTIGIDGTFLVRNSSRDMTSPYCLSVLVEGITYHSLINVDKMGRCLFEDSAERETKSFGSLCEMINYYRDHSLLLIRSRPSSIVQRHSCVTKLGLFPDRSNN